MDMAQRLVGLINNLNVEIEIRNTESGKNTAAIPPGQVMVVEGYCDIPDCSGQPYFKDHHMELRNTQNGQVLYCFWGDDHANYVIQYCPGSDYTNHQTMKGGTVPNETKVVIQVDNSGLSAKLAVPVGS